MDNSQAPIEDIIEDLLNQVKGLSLQLALTRAKLAEASRPKEAAPDAPFSVVPGLPEEDATE